ncbi:thimet oligopeptidase [Trypanosoma cruzi]|nr:thimet oligopeptidase [Trypanosoma cruzi]
MWQQELVWAIGMLLQGGELGSVCGHAQWQDTPLGRIMQGCQQLRGEAPQGAPLSGEWGGSAADPDTHAPSEAYAASTADSLTPSRASLACRGWNTSNPLQLPLPQTTMRCSAFGARMWCGEISMWRRTRRSPLRTASPGREMVVAAFQCIDDGMVSKQIAPRTSSIYRRRVRCSCCVGARNPMILRSGAGLAAGWKEAPFDDARGPSDAVQLSRCRTSKPWR